MYRHTLTRNIHDRWRVSSVSEADTLLSHTVNVYDKSYAFHFQTISLVRFIVV